MLGSLLKEGVEITNHAASADVVIVNTCSFIDAAQEESVDAVLESAALREARNRGQGLIVSGCLSQRFRDDLPKLLPEVDAFMGIDQVAQVGAIVREAMSRRASRLGKGVDAPSRRPGSQRKIVEKLAELDGQGSKARLASKAWEAPEESPVVRVSLRPSYVPDYATPRFRLTPKHFAYLKIAEGCNHPCSFCTIPRMRGSHRSRPQADIVKEAKRLIAEGVKELNLISQDSTYYGLDLRSGRTGSIASPERFGAAARALPKDATTLGSLLRALNELKGDFWIRLLYTHPAHWTDELIETIADCPKVARYVDMPLQHIHPNMLERMRRETSREHIENLIQRLRARIPGMAIRTTFIVGFPGETDACFNSLVEFIRDTKFERLGVFTYSREEGTRAAKMLNQVPSATKKRRREVAMAEQLQVARQVAQSFVGREIRVLVEKEANATELAKAQVSSWEHGLLRGSDRSGAKLRGRYWVARGEADAPDIDGRVFLRGPATAGRFARVEVIGHTDYDLVARSVSAP